MVDKNDTQKELFKNLTDGKILKEEQKDILRKLLEHSGNKLSLDEHTVLMDLMAELDSGAKRLKKLRKKAMPKNEFDTLMSILQTDEDDKEETQQERPFQLKFDEKKVPPKEPAPEVSRQPKPMISPEPKPQFQIKPQPKPVVEKPVSKVPPVVSQKEEVSTLDTESAGVQPILPKKEEKPVEASEEFSPSEVVTRYINAWNQKAFAVEYECFMPGMFSISLNDYVDTRMAVYLQSNKVGETKQELERIYREDVRGNSCEVNAYRLIITPNKTIRYADLYIMEKVGSSWKIKDVETKIESQERRKKVNQ